MGNIFSGPHLLMLLVIILLLFGAAKLPALAKSMGQSARVFRGEMKAMKEEDAVDKADNTVADSIDGTTTSAPKKPDTPPLTS